MNYRIFVRLSLVELVLIENVSSNCLLTLIAVMGVWPKGLGVWEGVDGR